MRVYTEDYKNPEFRWLFGSMGQLGVIIEANLRIIKKSNSKKIPVQGIIKEIWEESPDIYKQLMKQSAQEKLYWFTFFIPQNKLQEVRSDLSNIMAKYSDLLQIRLLLTELISSPITPFLCMGFYQEN